MQRNSTAIDRQNISVLPTDERIFPADVVALARRIRDGVRAAYGVTLVPEPNLVGVQL